MPIDDAYSLRSSLALAIQDAILLGNVRELDDILFFIRDDQAFPNELRYGLEALRHFRAYYGRNGELHPRDNMQQKKMNLMETAWSAELLEFIRHNGEEYGREKSA